jgi:hypothetical protein
MTEMSSQGRSTWLVFGGIVFVLVLALMFLIFAGSKLRRRWGHGHFSGSRTDVASTFVVS